MVSSYLCIFWAGLRNPAAGTFSSRGSTNWSESASILTDHLSRWQVSNLFITLPSYKQTTGTPQTLSNKNLRLCSHVIATSFTAVLSYTRPACRLPCPAATGRDNSPNFSNSTWSYCQLTGSCWFGYWGKAECNQTSRVVFFPPFPTLNFRQIKIIPNLLVSLHLTLRWRRTSVHNYFPPHLTYIWSSLTIPLAGAPALVWLTYRLQTLWIAEAQGVHTQPGLATAPHGTPSVHLEVSLHCSIPSLCT